MTTVDDYVVEKEKARITKETIEHNFRFALLNADEKIKQDGELDRKRLNDASVREAYVAAFSECALKGAKEITKGIIPAGSDDPTAQMYLMRAAYGVTISDVAQAVEEYGEQADPEILMKRKFYRALNDTKSDIDASVYGRVKISDKDQIIDQINSEKTIFDKGKIKQTQDLVAILEEFYRNKIITPTFIDLLKKENRDLFL